MQQLALHFDTELQGSFELRKLNLLLVFQVNCPGCFSYALPFFNKLYVDFNRKGVSCIALSTAFEDFDKNTLENTRALLTDGTLVGETKKFMSRQGIDKLPYTLDFPVAMDAIGNNHPEEIANVTDIICKNIPDYTTWPEFEKSALRERVRHYLESLEQIALTFTLNQLRGTPSFVLFNSEYEILGNWFGHVPYEDIAGKVTGFL